MVAQDGMIGSAEPHHLKGEDLLPVVGRGPESDGQVDLPERHRLFSRHDAVEWRLAGAEAGAVNPHSVEGLGVEDVEAAASIHEHLDEARRADDGVDDEGVASWMPDASRVVGPIEGDG
ncbi:hypothetical protein SEVIR_2G221866v4 [Setaria viridis]